MSTTIRDHIRSDLASRLASGLCAPAELTLAALSRHYGVSFTPIRQALRGLVSDGLLEKREDGRVQARSHRSAARTAQRRETPATLPNRGAELEAALASEVMARSLRREGGYLREEAAAERFGVGRTAIRQALARLAGRGLVDHVPRCGWQVRAFDASDLEHYLEVRELLELKALDLARPHLDPADLKRMLAGNLPRGRTPRLDNQIHRYLIDKSGNPYIRDFFDRHGAYYTTLFDFAAPETHVNAAMARQHRAILRALLDRDWPRARRALAQHIRGQRPIVTELIRRLGSPDSATRSTPGARS